ncbi:MAG: hypothetical protein GXP55_04860 [Deltaproteobacteria bacterium]|nr:hypothetical protein [Deltaproteobacteria bacterium]
MSRRGGVSRGRLRVDAARAVAKLREYQLADPNAWLQEVVRAAAALGATKVHVQGDADDIFVCWEGGLVDSSVLPRLFDELVNPTTSESQRGLRLLATGVNAALGMSPRWVKLYRITEARCDVVSYAPDVLLDEDGDGRSGLAELAVEQAEAPPEAPARGMLLRFRRRLSGQVLRSLVTGSEAPELRALRRAADDSALPILIGAGTTRRERSSTDLLRVDLGAGLDGFVAVVRSSAKTQLAEHPLLVVAELGVHIVSRPHSWIPGVLPRVRPPLRLFVDAPRMPTNAARSDVRASEPPIADAIDRAQELLPQVCERLVDGLEQGGDEWRRAALSLLAFTCAGNFWDNLRGIPPSFDALTRAPLLRNAAGQWCSLRDLAEGPRVAHLEAEPVPEELADLLAKVIWLPPDDPSWILLAGRLPKPATEIVNDAFRRRAARLAWQERSRVNAPLEHAGERLAGVQLSPPDLPAGAAIEVVLTTGRGGEVSFRCEGREVERLETSSGLGLSARVEYPGLTPNDSYDAVERDQAFHDSMYWVQLASVMAAEELAKEGLAGGVLGPAQRHSVRLASGRLANLKARGEESKRALGRLLKGALMRAEVWPRADGSLMSAAELRADLRAERRLVICREGQFPHSTLDVEVLVLDDEAADALRSLAAGLGRRVASLVVDYFPPPHGGAAARAARAGREASAQSLVSLVIVEEQRRGAVAWGVDEGFVSFSHLGKPLGGRRQKCALVPALFLIDDDRILPDSDWEAMIIEPPVESLEEWELSLTRAVADATLGRHVTGLSSSLVPGGATELLLIALARAEDAEALLGAERLNALVNAGLLSVLGSRQKLSIAEWAAATPDGPLPYVHGTQSAGLAMREFRPAVLEREAAAAAASLVDRSIYDAESELRKRRRRARREAGRARFLERPKGEPVQAPEGVHVKLRSGNAKGFLSLPRGRPTGVTLRIQRRTLGVLASAVGLPVHVLLEGDWSLADEDVREPAKGLRRRLRKTIRDAAGRLLIALAQTKPEQLFTDDEAQALLMSWLTQDGRPDKTLEALSELAFWPSVQGPLVSVDQATRRGRVRAARWSGEWQGPGEGKRSSLDRPILWLPEGKQATEALEKLARDRKITDSTRAVRKLQAQRQVTSGTVPRPRLKLASPHMTFDLSELGSGGKELVNILGSGVGALIDGEAALLRVFEAGTEAILLCAESLPAVELAVESPVQVERTRKQHRNAPVKMAEFSRLMQLARAGPEVALGRMDNRVLSHMRRAMRLLVTATLERLAEDERPAWLTRQLRMGVAKGALEGAALEQELFPTTAGERVSYQRLEQENARLNSVWFSSLETHTKEPLPEDRLAVILSPDEATGLGKRLRLVEATEELRRADALAAAMAQKPLKELKLSAAQRDAALVLGALRRIDGEPGWGLVVPLTPEGSGLRRVHTFRSMRPLPTRADPCEWPSLCLIDDPSFEPPIETPGEQERVRTEALDTRLSDASEAALAELFQAPPNAMAQLCITAEMSRRVLGERANFRGVLWLEPSVAADTVQITGDGFRVDLMPERGEGASSPMRGRLITTTNQHLVARSSAKALCDAALPRLLRDVVKHVKARIAEGAVGDARLDAALTLVAWGGLARLLKASELGALPLPCVAPADRTMQLLLRLGRSQARLEVLTPEQARELSPVDPVLIDDGSALARLLIERFAVVEKAAMDWTGRQPIYVICDRLNRLLRASEVDEGWLPIRPGRTSMDRLIEVKEKRGARLNQRSRSVRKLVEAVTTGAPEAAEGVAQLAVHVLMRWLSARGVSPSDDEGVAAMIRLMQAADEAAGEPLD